MMSLLMTHELENFPVGLDCESGLKYDMENDKQQ